MNFVNLLLLILPPDKSRKDIKKENKPQYLWCFGKNIISLHRQ